MHNYLYQITNIINNKIYIGVHKTDNLNDGYMGSGKVIKSAIEKYGIKNFKKEILETFDTYEQALAREAEIVTPKFLLREDVYNLRRGGFGGFDYINRSNLNGTLLGVEKRQKLLENTEWKNNFLTQQSDGRKRYLENTPKEIRSEKARKGNIKVKEKYGKYSFEGKTHTEKSKRLIGEKNKNNTGDKNSQFGSMWITNGLENKKIKNTDSIPDGWSKGRTMVGLVQR